LSTEKEDIMKELVLCIALAFMVMLVASSVSLAENDTGIPTGGICLDVIGSCNDYYLSLEYSAPGVLALHGYEYGCGDNDRLGHGVMHIIGNYAYIGITCSSGSGFDYGIISNRNYVINLSTKTGTMIYTHVYLSGGSLTGHGGESDVELLVCPSPPSRPPWGSIVEQDDLVP
jgi:hypothetical protein